MSERSIVITEEGGAYQIHNSVFNEFELLGILEQIIFDLKQAKSSKINDEKSVESQNLNLPESKNTAPVEKSEIEQPAEKLSEATSESSPKATPKNSAMPELKTRIGNAVKAIKDLGGKVENIDVNKLSAEELQTELEELTAQYKRLKTVKG